MVCVRRGMTAGRHRGRAGCGGSGEQRMTSAAAGASTGAAKAGVRCRLDHYGGRQLGSVVRRGGIWRVERRPRGRKAREEICVQWKIAGRGTVQVVIGACGLSKAC